MPGGVAGNRTPPRARPSSGQLSCGRHCVTPRPRRSHPRCSLPRGHRRHRSTCQTERATVRRPSHTTLGSGVTRLWRRCRRRHRGVERAWQGVYGANEGARSGRQCPSDAWRRWCESWRRTSASCRAAAPAAAGLSHTWPGPAHARRRARWQRAAPQRRRGVRVGQAAGRPARRRQTRSAEAVVAAAAASPECKREAACLSPTQLAPCPHAQPSRRRASVCGHLVSRVQGYARSRRQQCRRSLHPIARLLRFVAGFPPHARTHSSTDDDNRSSPPSSPHHCNTRNAGDTLSPTPRQVSRTYLVAVLPLLQHVSAARAVLTVHGNVRTRAATREFIVGLLVIVIDIAGVRRLGTIETDRLTGVVTLHTAQLPCMVRCGEA